MLQLKMTDSMILDGFRQGDATIIRKYFYGYCKVGYSVFDQRYQLSEKENLDFMSMAHQYALYLIEHEWAPLESRSPNVSLKTWLINGLRYVVLDALKWYKREYGSITYEDYLRTFDIDDSGLRLQFNNIVQDVCDHAPLSRQDRLVIDLMLLQGYKGKEVAETLGMTPSAVSQRFKRLKDEILLPYFRNHFDMDMDMPEVMDEPALVYSELTDHSEHLWYDSPTPQHRYSYNTYYGSIPSMKKRTTPEFITELQPNEIFVFGSNLKGLHGGGAAYIAYRKFGAIIGQGVGLQGQSYAIPTMQGGVETIRPYVDEFIRFARQHPELTFLVTRIGCGIAGFTDDEIAPLFRAAHGMENIVLPPNW
jgi:RNA polymerase sigma factor (sigma-70 family)